MNENREGRLSEEQESYLQLLEASPGWKPEVIKLVREDFHFGLTKDQVVKYVKKNSDIQRMKLYSECLRKGYAQEDVDVLMDENLDVYRCQAAVEFYGKGVPIEVVKKVMGDTHNVIPRVCKAERGIVQAGRDTVLCKTAAITDKRHCGADTATGPII